MTRHLVVCLIAACVLPAIANAQLSVTDGLQLWLDATDASTLYEDSTFTTPATAGGAVGGWLDKSGNDYHALQMDTALTPSYSPTALGGSAALRFDGAQGAGMAIDESLVLERPYSIFIVNQYNDIGEARGRTLQGLDSNWLHGLWAGNVSSYADGFVGANSVADVNTPYVADTTGTPDGASTLYVNGLDVTVNPAPTGAPGRLGLISTGMFGGEVSDADISEVIVYDRVLSEGELGNVRDYLYGKYNPTIIEPPAPLNTVNFGNIGAFSGADAGEGLDLDGDFPHAINVGGPESFVGSVVFTDGSEAGMNSPGVTITDANEIGAWHAPEYGDSAADDGLETVMSSIRWNFPPGVEVDLEVEAGEEYRVQLLFAEQCCNRGFDILVEGELAVDNFSIPATQGGDLGNTTAGAYFSHTFTAADDVLNIALGGSNPLVEDNNPTISGITVEKVPEPASLSLLALGVIGILSIRRKR